VHTDARLSQHHGAGDHLYRMNYEDFVAQHRETNADITIAALPTDEEQAEAFGVMKIDGTGRITEFAEKVKGDKLRSMRVDTTVLGLDAERCAQLSRSLPSVFYLVDVSFVQSCASAHVPEIPLCAPFVCDR
jgi:glucose-1-phosphate adenylyltransferase